MDLCPRLLGLNSDYGYTLSTQNRSVDSIVNVFCNNRTIAVLKCLSNRTWNGTLTECQPELQEVEEYQVETIIIIVWVLGGVLLLALLILLAVIITSHRKGGRDGSPRTSIFTISPSRSSRGGDNPAFTTENETPGQPSLRRSGSHRNSLRPPSYHEAVSGRIVCLPGMAARMSPNITRATPSGGRREINSPRSRPREERSGTRGRYVYDYPSCYWEEEPPPPYSLVVGIEHTSRSIPNPPSRAHQNATSEPSGSHHAERSRSNQASAPIARLEYDCF